jgi:integrase
VVAAKLGLERLEDQVADGRRSPGTLETYRRQLDNHVGLSARQIADQLGHARRSMTQDVYMGRHSKNP